MNLILIGLRGSGKTSVGKLLAERLKRAFVDLDDAVARALGHGTVAAAWRARGEGEFRRAEADELRRVLQGSNQVVALGGGTPTAPGAADLLRAERDAGRAVIVYLAGAAATFRERLSRTDLSARPSLTGADPLEEIDVVLARRDPVFRELASIVLATDGLSVEQIAERAVELA